MNRDQRLFYGLAIAGHNGILLGRGGTGKTFVVEKIASALVSSGKKIQLTSSTGISTKLFKGATTLHSFAGIGTCRWNADTLIQQIARKPHVVSRLQEVDTLIIDECSMISSRLFELVEVIVRHFRKSEIFFGGMQILLSGDFWQLPPVKNEFDEGKYLFESIVFNNFSHIIVLQQVIRQKEKEFVMFLNDLAEGKCDQSHVDFVNNNLTKNLNPADFDLDFIPKIVSTNREIFFETLEKLETVPGEMFFFDSVDSGKKAVLKRCIADQKLILKIGVPVMLLYNIDQDLVNGLCGTIVKIQDGLPIVFFPSVNRTCPISPRTWTFYDQKNPHVAIASRSQVPLKVSWAITSHKSQGQTLTAAKVTSGCEFVSGQLYVACSRVKTMAGLQLIGFDLTKLVPPSDKVKSFYARINDCEGCNIAQDLSCCKKVCENNVDELAFLGFVDWEEEPTFDGECLVPMEEGNDLEEFEELGGEDGSIDFDDVLDILENVADLPEFPPGLSLKHFIEQIVEVVDIDLENRCPSQLKNKIGLLCDSLGRNEQTVSYLKIIWHKLTSVFVGKADDKVERKKLTDFCSEVFALCINEKVLSDFSVLIKISPSDINYEHRCVSTNIIFLLSTYFLHALASKLCRLSSTPVVSLSEKPASELGKVRYVMGWVFRRLMDQLHGYVSENATSRNEAVRNNIHTKISQIRILENMIVSQGAILNSSEYKESLDITFQKQNRTQGLLNVVDRVYQFAIALEEKRVNLLTHAYLRQLKGDLIDVSVDKVLHDDQLRSKWSDLCDDKKEMSIVNELYDKVVKFYFRMGAGEYLRDFRRDMKWKKTEAHRKKVLMRTEKKEMALDAVKLSDIRDDKSEGKQGSHILLKAMLQKQPDIFTTRLYTVSDIELLLKAYGVNKKNGKKAVLAARLVEAIGKCDSMVDLSVF